MMSDPSRTKSDPLEDTGVTDVRVVRERIADRYNGDLRKHVAETEQLVEPLIAKLGLRQSVSPRHDEQRSGTTG